MPSQPDVDPAEPSPAPKPRSSAQIEASRLNGARSRGPVTPEGKRQSSMNALRHGCSTGNFALLRCEDAADLQELARQFEAGLGPVGEAERALIGRMVRAEWRSRRLERLETQLFERAIAEADGPDGDGRDADGKEIDPFVILDSPRLRTLMRHRGAERCELYRAHDTILRQRQACERTERHDKAMKEDHACRGFYYGPAGRYPNHDTRWVPLSAASETVPPADPTADCRNEPELPPDPPVDCRNEPDLSPNPLADCRNEPGPANDDAALSPKSPGAEAAKPAPRPGLRVVPDEPEPAAGEPGPGASPTCRRRCWRCGATRRGAACIRPTSSASSPPPGPNGTPIRRPAPPGRRSGQAAAG